MSMTVFGAIQKERVRQAALKKAGKLKFTCDELKPTNTAKLAALVEEVGEVAKAVHGKGGKVLPEELTQVAAICTAWLEGIETAAVKAAVAEDGGL